MKLAVFDCDGTLVDSQASICAAMEGACAECGIVAPPRSEVRRAVGLSLAQSVRALVPGADVRLQNELVEAYKRHFRAAREAGALVQELFEGMAGAIAALAGAGWQLGVATGMSRRGLDHCLAVHGLAGHFVTLQTADIHPSKPHPAMLEAALAEAGSAPAQAVMIGDTAYDIEMAVAAGVRAIGISWGYHCEADLLEAGAQWVAPDAESLVSFLLK